MECTSENLRAFVAKRGLLKSGAHSKDNDDCCILEARSLCMGLEKTDDPDTVNMPDIRTLNDAPWSSDELRTEHMLRLDEALRPWATANQNQRINFAASAASAARYAASDEVLISTVNLWIEASVELSKQD